MFTPTLSETADALLIQFQGKMLRILMTVESVAGIFRGRSVPSGDDIENAIAAVEDALMLALRETNLEPAPSGTLDTGAEAFARFAQSLGLAHAEPRELSIELVEGAFNQLADIANGSPSSRSPLPLDPQSVARLVILRELMHHLGFSVLRPTPS